MEAAPWRGVKEAILRLWTRRDARNPDKDDAQEGQSSVALETVTEARPALATVAQASLQQMPVPAPPTLTSQPSSSGRPRPPQGGDAALGEEEGEAGEQEAEASVCKAQEQLDSLIRNRGYLVKEHIPRKVLEEQVMENIRRRERIARILRQEETASPPQPSPTLKDLPQEHPERSAEMISLLTKVWSGKGASVQGRGSGQVDWTRSQFVQECLREHNRLRSLHAAPPLVVSEQLCNDAQAWANRLAHFGLLEYSSEHGRGENIMTSTAKEELTGSAVAKGWYETGRGFKYDVHGSADLAHAGPFSQVVWESTRALGVGIARGSEGRTVVVARYWPQGNIGGQFSTNVKPPVGDNAVTTVKTATPTMSRTRQEAQFFVSIALEPPGKTKKAEREKIIAALKLPAKKVCGEGLAGETLLAHTAAIDSLGATLTSCRNGAARTSRLFPICCVTPAKTEERWAQPSARSQHHQPDVAYIRRIECASRPTSTGAKAESSGHLSAAEPVQRHTASLRTSPRLGASPRLGVSPRLAALPRLGASPRLGTSPRLGLSSRLGASPKLGALPKLAASSRMGGSPKIVGSSRFGGSPIRGSPKRGVHRRGASPKPGSSPRRGAASRLRSLTRSGEHGVVVATL